MSFFRIVGLWVSCAAWCAAIGGIVRSLCLLADVWIRRRKEQIELVRLEEAVRYGDAERLEALKQAAAKFDSNAQRFLFDAKRTAAAAIIGLILALVLNSCFHVHPFMDAGPRNKYYDDWGEHEPQYP